MDIRDQTLLISCLGEFSLLLNGCERVTTRPKVSELLVLLVINRDAPLSRAVLGSQLWPNSDEEARLVNLRAQLKWLRRSLGAQAWRLPMDTEKPVLEMTNVQVDMLVFQLALRRTRQQVDPAGLEAVLSIYQGNLLPKSHVATIVRERKRLRKLYLNELESVAELYLQSQQRERAMGLLKRSLDMDPLCEILVGLMLRLTESDPREANRIFEIHHHAVTQKEGLKLSERIKAQHAQIQLIKTQGTPIIQETVPVARIDRVPIPQQPLVSRNQELEHIKNRLSQSSLVTLTGPSGVGKTRLALEIGSLCSNNYRDGAIFVDLSQIAPAASTEVIAGAIKSTLDIEVGSQDIVRSILDFFRKRHMLIILDNTEHVTSSVTSIVRTLLDASRCLTILVTSQVELFTSIGARVRIRPLKLPDPTDTSLEGLRKSAAAELFEHTARNCRGIFELTTANAEDVNQILRVTDGLPLAIHLVASADYLTLQELISQIKGGLSSIQNPGGSYLHPLSRKTPFEAVSWSYQLLTPPLQKMITFLAIFSGGWFREAIDPVLGDQFPETLQPGALLDVLRTRSLVERDEVGGRSRYRMLESVREFVLTPLLESEVYTILCERHLVYFLDRVEVIAGAQEGPALDEALSKLTLDIANLRVAFDYSLKSNQVEKALRLSAGLARFFYIKGLLEEGKVWMARVTSLCTDAAPALKWKTLHGIASIAYVRRDYDTAHTCWSQCLELSQHQQDTNSVLQMTGNLGLIAFATGDFNHARCLFDTCLKGFRLQENVRGVARALANLALVSGSEQDYKTSLAEHAESIAIFRELNDYYSIALGLNNLATVHIASRDFVSAHKVLSEALELSRAHENHVNLVHSLSNYVTLANAQNDPERAAILIGAEEAIRERISMPLPMEAQIEYQQTRIEIMRKLGADVFAVHLNVGAKTSLHELCRYARSVRDMPSD